MSVKVRINDRIYTLSWEEFEKLILGRTPKAPVEILSMG